MTTDHALENHLQSLATSTKLLARIAAASGLFVGCPYENNPNGEGRAGDIDQNPLYRFDAFDCLTYVNTVLALAHATDIDHFKKMILRVNYYQQQASYLKRFHFMSADWNPENMRQGYLLDVTEMIASQLNLSCHNKIAVINKRAWIEKCGMHALRLQNDISEDEQQQKFLELSIAAAKCLPNAVPCDYIALSDVPKINVADTPDDIMLIEFVRHDVNLRETIGTDILIGHLGFLLKHNQQFILRHASLIDKQIIDIPLADYLALPRIQKLFAGVVLLRFVF